MVNFLTIAFNISFRTAKNSQRKAFMLIKWHIYEAFMLRNGFVWPCIHIATKL